MRTRQLSLVACLLLATLPLLARAQGELTPQIDALLADPALRGGFQGVIVQSLADGSTWYERNADQLFLPASNQKLLTSSAALLALGPDWRYVTRVVRKGIVDKKGVLHGDLYLVGSGDPLLATDNLDTLAKEVKSAGICRIEGRVYGDDSRFDRERYGVGWSWDDIPADYSAQVSALNLNENVVRMSIKPGAHAGDPVQASVEPTGYAVKLLDRARTVAKGGHNAIAVGRELGRNVVTVDGTLAVDAKPADRAPQSVTVENPALYAASVFTERLARSGVPTTETAREGASPKAGVLEVAKYAGPPLGEVIQRMLKPSDNLIAECLMKTLGAEKGTGGTWASGIAVTTAWLKTLGVDPAQVDMVDGSGLSRQNFVTPRVFATVLRAMHSHPNGKLWFDALPIAGVDGTLRNRMKGTPAEGNCHAKTGYVSNVSSLSGYVTTRDGEPLLFSILMNNHPCRNRVATGIQDRIVALLAGWSKPR